MVSHSELLDHDIWILPTCQGDQQNSGVTSVHQFWESMANFSVFPLLGFVASPPENGTVEIPEGGEVTLLCQHNNSAVFWFQSNLRIIGSTRQAECDCVETTVSPGVNLTFSNIGVDSAGVYGCWAANPDNSYVECNFNLSVITGSYIPYTVKL